MASVRRLVDGGASRANTGTAGESSAATSLAELLRLETERQDEVRRAALRRRADDEAERREAARRVQAAEHARAAAEEAGARSEAAARREVARLRGELDEARRRVDPAPRVRAVRVTTTPPPAGPRCNPRDPLCADLPR